MTLNLVLRPDLHLAAEIGMRGWEVAATEMGNNDIKAYVLVQYKHLGFTADRTKPR